MSKNKWIYDATTNSYHNTDYIMEFCIDEVVAYEDGEKLYEIEALRVDGRYIQIGDREKDPRVLHKIILDATGGK